MYHIKFFMNRVSMSMLVGSKLIGSKLIGSKLIGSKLIGGLLLENYKILYGVSSLLSSLDNQIAPPVGGLFFYSHRWLTTFNFN